MNRTVTLALLDPDGKLLGALPPYPVGTPWWQEVAEVVAGARERYGVEVTVLRVLGADRPAPPGGRVTYLASCVGDPGQLMPAEVDLSPHPLRAPWAEPGGPPASIAWATQALAANGRSVTAVTQMRTWNLSAIWRLGTGARPSRRRAMTDGAGAAWLKQVPRFFAHEPAVLAWLAAAVPGIAPTPIAAADGRLLLEDIPGTDRHDAGTTERLAMLADLHTIQVRAVGRVDDLLAAGVPDLRGPRLAALVRDVVVRHGAGLDGPAAARLDNLVTSLDDRVAALAACGLPDTLVHGDFHPGNVRGSADQRTLIDWGDSVIGHPALDLLHICEESPDAGRLRAEWSRWWRAAVPGCDPERTVALLEPVAALRNAALYAAFLDAIEPSERPYHAQDVPRWLSSAADLDTRALGGPGGA